MSGFAKSIGAIVLALGLAALAAAGTAAAKEQILTEDSVTRFLASFAEMRDLAIADGLKTGTDSEAAKNPLGAVLKAIKSSKLKAESGKIAAAHGFANLKDWAKTGGAIAHAYIYITTGPSRDAAKDALAKNKQAAMDQLGKLGILSDSSKKKLKDNLDSLEDQLSHEPPPENVAIVKKMQAEIDAAVKFGVN
jgi:hypothetical protein